MPAPSPISGIGADGAAMLEVFEDRQPVLDDLVRLRPFMSAMKPTPQAVSLQC
jgi:hypothetical protein